MVGNSIKFGKLKTIKSIEKKKGMCYYYLKSAGSKIKNRVAIGRALLWRTITVGFMLSKGLIKQNKTLKEFLQKQGVILAYLFGSMARGDAHKESDVDIAVLLDKKVKSQEYLKREGELISFFTSFFPKKEINIVNLNISSSLLKQAVILEGKLFYAKNELSRILFEIQTLKEYQDYLELTNIYDKMLEREVGAL